MTHVLTYKLKLSDLYCFFHNIRVILNGFQEVAESVKKDFGTIDILVHSLANGPEVCTFYNSYKHTPFCIFIIKYSHC